MRSLDQNTFECRVQSRDPKSIRYSPSEWAAICSMAEAHGIEPSRWARHLSLIGLKIVDALDGMEAYSRIPLAPSRNTKARTRLEMALAENS